MTAYISVRDSAKIGYSDLGKAWEDIAGQLQFLKHK
jgi:hypothetical protein